MFFYTNQNNHQNNYQKNQNYMEFGRRYNLDMMSKVRKKNLTLDKNEEKRNRIISLKLIEPKNNTKWNEDIFEQIQLDEKKEKMKNLKILEPKTEKNTIDNRLYISDWNDE